MDIRILRNSKLFEDFTENDFEMIATIASERRLAAGDTIIHEGTSAHSLFMLITGTADVLKKAKEEAPPSISCLSPGDVCGEMCFLGLSSRTAEVIAHEDMILVELPYSKLENLMKEYPELGIKIYRILAKSASSKLKRTTDDLMSMIASSRLVALGQLAMAIGHEINNPLAVVQLNLQHLEEEIMAEPFNKSNALLQIARTKAVSLRITGIIKGLKMVGRKSQDDPLVRTSVREIVSDTTELCIQKYKANGVHLEVEPIADHLKIECRPGEIAQVLLNLLNNAVDAVTGLDEKWVKLQVDEAGDWIRIILTDSGPGVPKAIRDKIFEPFFTTKPLGDGTGLGLSISRKIIDSHGGQFQLDSDHTHTRFEIKLPR